MPQEIIDQVKAQKGYYRRNYHRSLRIFLIFELIILVLMAAVFFLEIEKPQPSYYATISDGRLIKIKLLSGPNNSSSPLI